MNKVILLGHLGADPELRFSQGGLAILSMRVATNERVKKAEEWTDHTEWHSVVIFGKRADALSKFLRKGRAVSVEGCNRTSSWEKDGVKRYKTEVIASDVNPVGGDKVASAAGSNERAGQESEDIPF